MKTYDQRHLKEYLINFDYTDEIKMSGLCSRSQEVDILCDVTSRDYALQIFTSRKF